MKAEGELHPAHIVRLRAIQTRLRHVLADLDEQGLALVAIHVNDAIETAEATILSFQIGAKTSG